MPSQGFCPRCGQQLSSAVTAGSGGLCAPCHLSVIEPLEVPATHTITTCGTCGAVQEGERWRDTDAGRVQLATAEVEDMVAVHRSIEVDDWGLVAHEPTGDQVQIDVELSGTLRGEPTLASEHVTVTFATAQCHRCGRIAGGYFASVLQVRAAGRVPTDAELNQAETIASAYIRRRIDVGDRNAFISDVQRNKDGLDIKLSTNQIGGAIAKQLTDRLGGEVRSHPTLVTEDGDGNEVYRVTYTVRLPRYTTGDIISLDGFESPIAITNLGEHITGLQLGPYIPVYLDQDTAAVAHRLGHLDDVLETTVVAPAGEDTLQVLHPKTMQTVTVRQPPGDVIKAGVVTVFVDADRVWPVPDDPAASIRQMRQEA
jgi:NMD protein affecting ribosome stability and mRNA decay